MKLSSFAFLFSAAVAALSGASATTDIDTEFLAINCDKQENRECFAKGINTCNRIYRDCNKQCYWDGSTCRPRPTRTCRSFSNRNQCINSIEPSCVWIGNGCRLNSRPPSTRRPTPRPTPRRPTPSTSCSDYGKNTCQRNGDMGCFWDRNVGCYLVCSNIVSSSTCNRSANCSLDFNGQCKIDDCIKLDGTSFEQCVDNSCRWNNNGECDPRNLEEVE